MKQKSRHGSMRLHTPRALLLIICYFLFSPAGAQEGAQPRFLRGDCTPQPSASLPDGQLQAPRRPLTLKTQWDPDRTYQVAVLLVSFADRQFQVSAPADYYNRLFNQEGYNEGKGPGCVADYYREQSNGCFNPQFDIYGPIQLEKNATANGTYGSTAFREAIGQLKGSQELDFTPYDWDGDGQAEHIICIYAGYGGNENSLQGKGYIWPNTSSFSAISAGGVTVSGYSASPELWSDNSRCGIGTICHEYSHTLGLPDIYPTAGSEYSVCDEWDLMDGGNYADDGWCPPSLSAHERMLLGWLVPEELAESVTVSSLMPLAQDGRAYIVRTNASANEFFLLENRQWSGWDLCTPGHGLLISHVDYSPSAWSSNRVNTSASHHRYDLVHADNRNYDQWDDIVGKNSPYRDGHSLLLSGTAYPQVNDTLENRALTDTSVPAATTYSGTGLLSKPITDITEDGQGGVSFNFMGGETSGIAETGGTETHPRAGARHDLLGRRVHGQKGITIVRQGEKTRKTITPTNTNNHESHY